MVERHLAKVDVAGSNPVSRSISRYCVNLKPRFQVDEAQDTEYRVHSAKTKSAVGVFVLGALCSILLCEDVTGKVHANRPEATG